VNPAPSAGSGQVLEAGQVRDRLFECQETGSQDSGYQGVRLDAAGKYVLMPVYKHEQTEEKGSSGLASSGK
jgi:hypothetical protein